MDIYFDSLKKVYLLSQIDRIRFDAQSDSKVEILVNNKLIYSETFYIANNNVGFWLYDFYSLVDPYFDFEINGVRPLNITLKQDNVAKDFQVFWSNIYKDFNGWLPFGDGYFLSNYNRRTIFEDEPIILPFYCTNNVVFDVNVITVRDDFSIKMEISPEQGECFQNINTDLFDICSLINEDQNIKKYYDVNPEDIVYISFKNINSIEIEIAVCHNIPEIAKRFNYINSWGALDSILIPGAEVISHVFENKLEYSSYSIVQSARNDFYEREINSAILFKDVIDRIREMFLSRKLWAIDEFSNKNEAIITKIDDKLLSSDDALYSAKFSYRLANLKVQ